MALNRIAFSLLMLSGLAVAATECDGWKTRHPEWIFCDDFESTGPLVASGRYFEHNDNGGEFLAKAGAGLRGGKGMRALWKAGGVEAGNLKLGFGRSPSAYFSKGIRTDADFREIYYRMYVRLQPGWKGNPYKLSRATVMAKGDWSQAMIAHVWGDKSDKLQLDPVSCTDLLGAVKCAGYNDFVNMQWIGAKSGNTPVFDGAHDDRWLCVETHVRLNDAGAANGVHEYWIGDTLEARREGLNFLGKYSEFGLNAVFLENYWNSGSPQAQERYFDAFVVSTQRIGCAEASGATTSLEARPAKPPHTGIEGAAFGISAAPLFRSAGGLWSPLGRRWDITPPSPPLP